LGVSYGRVEKIERARSGAYRLTLDRGSRVQVSKDLSRRLFAEYSPAHTIYFVDQGFFAKVFWLGTAKELRHGVATGEVPTMAIGNFPVPRPVSGIQPGWEKDMEDPFRHDDVGAKLEDMREVLARHGRTDFAATMTLDTWLGHMRSRGACLAQRMHGGHIEQGVWCIAPADHPDEHVAACPTCEIVAVSMKLLAESAGEWGEE
jgi:hypothetical protein